MPKHGGGGAELVYRLRRLPLTGDVLYVGAHPDDEDNGLVALLARGHGVRVAYWSATRGEGGQSRVAPYTGDELGVYRTWESLAAAAVNGGDALFGPFYDYGFSKNGAEALDKWGHDALVRELVRAIRAVQPQLVVSRWRGDASDGHGHHTAVGVAVQEAFAAAADGARFPELEAAGLPPWQPRKLYQGMSSDWQPGEDVQLGVRRPDLEELGCLRVNTGRFDPIAGSTYQEQGTLALNEHLTQGTGDVPVAGDHYLYYRLAMVAPELDAAAAIGLYDGIDIGLTGLADHPGEGARDLRRVLTDLQERAQAALCAFRVDEPWHVGADLLELLRRARRVVETLDDIPLAPPARRALERRLRHKEAEIEAAAAACLGLRLDASLDRAHLTPGESVRLTARLWRYGPDTPTGVDFGADVSLPGAEVTPSAATRDDHHAAFDVTLAADAPLSSPYWLRVPHDQRVYEWPDVPYLGEPFAPSPIAAVCAVQVAGERLELRQPALYRDGFAGGFRELEPAVLPPISARATTSRRVVRAGDIAQSFDFSIGVLAHRRGAPVEGVLELEVPDGWTVEPARRDVLLREGDADSIDVRVIVPPGAEPGTHDVHYGVRCGGRLYEASATPVLQAAPGLGGEPDEATCVREQFIARRSVVQVDVVEVEVHEAHSYAYVSGVGDEVPLQLTNLGLPVHVLTDEELAHAPLAAYDTIVIGPNAYLVRDALRKAAQRLLAYVHDGGTLVVQYQGYPHEHLSAAPYPFRYHQPHDRVTLERAPVRIVSPEHFLLRFPNRIADSDFAGWVRDRGMYFFGEWDERYEPLLACADPGEEEKLGGLLVASYGKGMYAYCGYTLYRQLAAGVGGGFRLFANLLALPEGRIRRRMEELRAFSLFRSLADEELHHVAEIATERRLGDGEYLCREGDEGSDLYLIESGLLEVLSGDPERKVSTCVSGEPIGELAAFAGGRRAASLRSAGTTHVLLIHRDDFLQLARRQPEIGERVIELLARRLATALAAADGQRDGAPQLPVYE